MSRAERGFGVAPLVVLHGGTFRRLTGNIRVYFLGRAWGGSKNQCIPEPARARCRQHFEPREKGALHQAREDDPFGRYQAGGQKGGGGRLPPNRQGRCQPLLPTGEVVRMGRSLVLCGWFGCVPRAGLGHFKARGGGAPAAAVATRGVCSGLEWALLQSSTPLGQGGSS